MKILFDILEMLLFYLPLISGAYITILILRFADLTIEASWSLGAIVSCLSAIFLNNSIFSPLFGLLAGGLCGLTTWIIFCVVGRTKLLSSLISYFILTAVGFHLLGDKASIILSRELTKFGYAESNILPNIIYSFYVIIVVFFIYFWQKSKTGIISRLLGETPQASKFYDFSIIKYYGLGLIISNAIIGLGGGLFGIYYGLASNLQGIDMLIKAFLALLIGDSILSFMGFKRPFFLTIILGTFLYVTIKIIGEVLITKIIINISIVKSSDISLILGLVFIFILLLRRKSVYNKKIVSEW
jgi:putative tryptophan/tyrosine transport system permease protein